MAIYKFKSRYSEHDTSYLLPENQPRQSRPWWCACIICCCRAACASRRRAFASLLVILALAVGGNNATSILSAIDDQSPRQAHRQSYGYIDTPKWKWKSQQEHYKRVHSTSRIGNVPDLSDISVWYDSNIEVDLTCPDQEVVANQWSICNPKHLDSQRHCIVYSTGPPSGLQLENTMQDLLPSCTIHFFDPLKTTSNSTNSSVIVHYWGFSNATEAVTDANTGKMELKTVKDTMKTLGHSHIDLLVLSCGGCEWTLDLGQVPIQQALVVLNGVSDMGWFERMSENNFALFYKQPINVGGVLGRSQVLSYLKLRKSFFV